MGLIASGSNAPNTSTLVGMDGSFNPLSVGPGPGVILAVMDCRNANGIMPVSLNSSGLLPNLAVSAVVQDPVLTFRFFNDISQLMYVNTLVGSPPPIAVSSITSFPTVGLLLNGTAPSTVPNSVPIATVTYRWPAGGNYMFADVVPVLGPFCVAIVSGVGLFDVTVNQGSGSFNPLLLSNSRDDYANVRGKLGTFVGGENGVSVGPLLTVARTVPLLVSGEVYISGSATISGASALTIVALGVAPDASGTFVNVLITRIVSDAAGNYPQTRVVLPPCYLQVSITNSTAGNMLASYWIVKGEF